MQPIRVHARMMQERQHESEAQALRKSNETLFYAFLVKRSCSFLYFYW